jgi:hypothetical protein
MRTGLIPEPADVVVRRGAADAVYLIGTRSTPDQYIVHTREKAVADAVSFARRLRVRAWFTHDGDVFELLGAFRDEDPEPATSA